MDIVPELLALIDELRGENPRHTRTIIIKNVGGLANSANG